MTEAPLIHESLVRVENLSKHFPVTRGILIQRVVGAVRAVDNVSFTIEAGETLGMVGESGCGKTTAGRTLLGLYPATTGKVYIDGHCVQQARGKEMLTIRRKAQMIFQDPYASLNPRMSVGEILAGPLLLHAIVPDATAARARVGELLDLVGLAPSAAGRFPHEFSGGQRQRISIARALAVGPDLVVADEPISALDVNIQAQIINLMVDLQERLGLTYLFIAHDLAVVRHVCDRIVVLYLGKVMEVGRAADLFNRPLHPYTRTLISAAPVPDPRVERARRHVPMKGEPPSAANPPSGCRFRTRCPVAQGICAEQEPLLQPGVDGQRVACHFPGSI